MLKTLNLSINIYRVFCTTRQTFWQNSSFKYNIINNIPLQKILGGSHECTPKIYMRIGQTVTSAAENFHRTLWNYFRSNECSWKMSKQKYYYSILYMRFETNVFVIHKMHSSVLFLPAHIVRVGRRRHTSQWAMSSMLNFIRTSAALFGEQHITAAFVLIPIWSFSLFPGTPNITFVWRNSNISHTGERHCGKFAWTIAGRRSCNLGQSVGYSR